MPGEVSFSQAMSDYRAGSVSLDIYEPNLERRMAVPIRTVNALTHRVPVLSTVDGTLTRRLQMEDAGLLLMHGPHDPIEAMLDRVADLPAADLARMSDAAHRFAQREYSAEAAASTLVNAIEEAVERRAATSGARLARRPVSGSAPRPPHVLVISNVEPHHRELRVDIPFSAMFGRQLIDGFSIWSDGDFKFTTSSNVAEQVFDAIWVQRKITPEAAVALASLGRKFVYDIDDNLLATPGFRPAFSIESMQTVRNMISSSAVLSCSTARLAHLLQSVSGLPLVDKVVVTPNLLREPPPPPPSGPPGFLVWVSSDTPALTDSRAAVIKAIRDFCLAYGTRLACLGAPPPDLLTESEVEIVHVRQVPYASYLSLLRSFAPAIMACPMEAETDPATARFIDGKSDIKMLEALAGGLVGVFSRAHPYLDSDLPDAIMCDNTYAGWMEALGRAWQRSQRPVESPAIPVHRYASDTGISPWLAAIERVRLAVPLGCAEFRDALTLLQGRYGRRLLSEAEFEEDFYLKTYPDIRLALSSGMMPSAYSHYQADGYREGRMGRETDALEPHNEHFWANLLHTLGDMRVAVTNQDRHLEALKARRAARLRLRQA
jgi:hypothetical protein